MESPPVMKKGGGSSESGGSESGTDEKMSSRTRLEYFGWVYHLGTNSIGREFCHLRFLYIKGKYVMMYKRDPHENPGIKPIRRGVVGNTLMVEELGRRKVNDGDLYVIRFYNRLDEEKKGEVACASAGETRKWMEAFDQAKQQAEYELSQSSTRHRLSLENEIDLEGRRPRVRRYAHDLKKLIRIGHGPETLVRRSSNLGRHHRSSDFVEGDAADVIEAHEWRCVRTVNGVRIFEDVSDYKHSKTVLVKAVGVVDASPDTVFEVVLNLDRHRRYEWDALTGDLELVDCLSGHSDVVYGSYDPRCLTRWQSKRDFIFSRQWFRGQDGAYSLKAYIGANPSLTFESSTTLVDTKVSDISEFEDAEVAEEFYDAIAADSSSSSSSDDGEEDDDDNAQLDSKGQRVKLKNVSWAIARLALTAKKAMDGNGELEANYRSSTRGIPSEVIASEAGKKLPFILIVNLQVPAKPNYSLVLYYAADRPVSKNSLLGKFIDGTDSFRDSRFKLIPSIVQGYWMVKRAVGTKACLLGKAVTCHYLRQDNFLEVDVDIGSSSVARSVIGLVLGYVTSLVVDLAILIEGREEKELPEYILGTVRLNRVRLDTAATLEN
ncbi:hypothetical protein OSB04_021033 [Centaurea solstitialis]|uniref:START domain-containing protein n=1 Tax=Centaurea solstitialis TaxID=347529 RepID=A0AA38STG3_9ASTR|nr:hypothetical protein OSB04_021033 [Centaurea solstitialis]